MTLKRGKMSRKKRRKRLRQELTFLQKSLAETVRKGDEVRSKTIKAEISLTAKKLEETNGKEKETQAS